MLPQLAVGVQRDQPQCPLCERIGTSWFSFDGLTIARCDGCGSGFVVHSPDVERERRSHDESSRLYEAELDPLKPRRCWELLAEWAQPAANARILDIGCGEGKFLDVAREAGMTTAGVEISQTAARQAAEKGHQVYRQSIAGAAFARDEFDVAVMWDILEHLDQPRRALRNVAEALRPGGKLVVLTPMMRSIYDRLGVGLFKTTGRQFDRLVRMCWSRDHLFRFSAAGLTAVLEQLGFIDVRAEKILLLSLGSDAYAGGTLTPSWTSHAALNRAVSSIGVGVARMCRFHNKVLVRATRK